MRIRDYSLPAGWYPRDPDEVSRFLSGQNRGKARAAIAPHAGWYYSGRLSARAAASLDPDSETIVVLGGHLSNSAPLFAMEDAVRTPFGSLVIDADLRDILMKEPGGAEDRFRDNTVEVLLPMVHFYFPKAKLLWLRLSEEKSSFAAGKIIAKAAGELNRKISVLGSTDLTHYGLNYGFSPQGRGLSALRWVREVNDAAFIRAVVSCESDEVLLRAQRDRSSCSAGAVLGAMGFAQAQKLGSARLLQYATSADIGDSDEAPDSFVGYAAFAFGE